jgi:hypothetical protein
MTKQQVRVSEHLIRKLGLRRALTVEKFVMLWALYQLANGDDPVNVEALADEIGSDRSTVFRWQESFREAFPEWSTPRDLLDAAGVKQRDVLTVRKVGALKVSLS